jgi:hypothetical protein
MILSNTRGFYTIDNNFYDNKLMALAACKKDQEIKWHFHDEVYSQLDWTKRPQYTLKDLYKQRAQQLRDQYDYLVLHFSGGGDSWNILNTFLTNGIRLDEIYTRWAKAERKFVNPNPNNKEEWNIGSEFEYAVLPILEKIRISHPQINIVIDDYSEKYTKKFQEDQFLESDQFQMMGTFFRYNRRSEHEILAEKKNKRIGIIMGYDKINCTVENGDFYAYFEDGLGGTNTEFKRTIELFYWSPNFPSLPVLQAHYIKEYIENYGLNKTLFYRDLYTKICYPDYDINTFQVSKFVGTMLSKSESWVLKYNPLYVDSWRWSLEQMLKVIDDRFKQKKKIIVGLKKIKGRKYLIKKNCGLPDFCYYRHDSQVSIKQLN